jgi:stress-induced morphogen
MPERKEARDRAQATVDAARDQYTGPAHMSGGARNILVRVSSETWAALETIAQGRTLEALIAEAIENYVRKKSTPPPPA